MALSLRTHVYILLKCPDKKIYESSAPKIRKRVQLGEVTPFASMILEIFSNGEQPQRNLQSEKTPIYTCVIGLFSQF